MLPLELPGLAGRDGGAKGWRQGGGGPPGPGQPELPGTRRYPGGPDPPGTFSLRLLQECRTGESLASLNNK